MVLLSPVFTPNGRIKRTVASGRARDAISILVAGDAAEYLAQPTKAAREEFLRSTWVDTRDWRYVFAIAKASDEPIDDIEKTRSLLEW
jgi:hypothetical protein